MPIPLTRVSLTFIGVGFVVAMVSVLDLFPNSCEGAESRVWSSKNGYSTEAEFIGFNSEHKVVLRLKDGRVTEIALSVLSDADQEYIHRQTAKKDAAPTTPPATSAAPSTSTRRQHRQRRRHRQCPILRVRLIPPPRRM